MKISELDKYFTRPDSIPFINMSNNPYGTNFPQAEERIRDILDAFADCVEYIPEDKFRRKQWLSGARDFVGAHGEDGALLKQAWDLYMDIPWDQRQRVIITSPRSLISFAQKVKDNKIEKDRRDPETSEARRKKYTTGWFDDGEKWWDR